PTNARLRCPLKNKLPLPDSTRGRRPPSKTRPTKARPHRCPCVFFIGFTSVGSSIRIQAIGRLDLLPESVVAAIRAAETATAQYNLMTLTIAVGYGGREEIADAVRSFVKIQARQGASLSDVIERITPEAIACHLY